MMVTAAILVPDYRHIMSMVRHIVKSEPIPCTVRQKRIHHHVIAILRTQSADTCYDKVVECGMIVIAAALLIALEPITGNLIEILAYIGTATMMLRLLI